MCGRCDGDLGLLLEKLGWLIAEVVRGEVMWWERDLVEEYDERAGIREFDGGLDRESAEVLAYCEIVARYPDKTMFRAKGDGVLGPESVRVEHGDGETFDLDPDALYLAVLECADAITRHVLHGEDSIDDSDGMVMVRNVMLARAGPRAVEQLLWRLGEALEDI